MTPLEIDILLHYHAHTDEYPDRSSPAQREAFCKFVRDGFLTMDDNNLPGNYLMATYSPTEKLHVYIDALCRVPSPVQTWVIPGETE